ncbi:hypothetical protein ACFVW1_53905 [Streptomyces olivochromogenes]|uniref:hypothetical protein n=1 Tax=Streptomyces olivochromogenes TaxID=1963 RepID=UPI0036DE2BE5
MLVRLAVAIVLGAANLSEAEQLRFHHRPLLGLVASGTTARRTPSALDERTPVKIAKLRARVRRQVWSLPRLRTGNAGANTMADHVAVLTDALAQIPGPGRLETDSPGSPSARLMR